MKITSAKANDTLSMDHETVAPLLCAELIEWRSLRMAGDDAMALGLYGFGAAAHLVAQVARAQGRRVHAFTQPGDKPAHRHALSLGAPWAGGSDTAPPEPPLSQINRAGARRCMLSPRFVDEVHVGGGV